MSDYSVVAEIHLQLGHQANAVLRRLREQLTGLSTVNLNLGNAQQLAALNHQVSALNANLRQQRTVNHQTATGFRNLGSSILEASFAYDILRKSLSAVLDQERLLQRYAQVNLTAMSQTKSIGQAVRTSAIQTGAPSSQQLEMAVKLSQAGFSEREIQGMVQRRVLSRLLMSPEVAGLDPNTMIKTLVQLKSNWGLVGQQLEDTLDKLAFVSQKYPIDLSEILRIGSRTFPLGPSSKMSPEEMVSAATVIMNRMQLNDSSILGTNLRTILTRLQTPLVRKHLESYGIKTYERVGDADVYRGAPAILADIAEVYRKLPTGSVQQMKLLQNLGDVRTAIFSRSLIEHFEEYQEVLKNMNSGVGTLAKTMDIAQDSVATSVQKLKESLVDLVMSFAGTDQFRSGVKGLTETLDTLKTKVIESGQLSPMSIGLIGGAAGLYMRNRIGLGGMAGLGLMGLSAYLGDTPTSHAISYGTGGAMIAAGLVGLSNPLSILTVALTTATSAVYGFGQSLEGQRHGEWAKEQGKREQNLAGLATAGLLKSPDAARQIIEMVQNAEAELRHTQRDPQKRAWSLGSYLASIPGSWLGTYKSPIERVAAVQAEERRATKNRLLGQTGILEQYIQENAGRADFLNSKEADAIRRFGNIIGKDLLGNLPTGEQKAKTPKEAQEEEKQQRAEVLADYLKASESHSQARQKMSAIAGGIYSTQTQRRKLQTEMDNRVFRPEDSDLRVRQLAHLQFGASESGELIRQLRADTKGLISGSNDEYFGGRLSRLSSVFELLTDSGTRLSGTHEKLAQLEQALSQTYGYSERYFVADEKERQKMNQAKEYADRIIAGGRLDIVPTEMRSEVMSYFNSLSNTETNGTTLGRIKERRLEELFPDMFTGLTQEKRALQERQQNVLNDVERLQKAMLESQTTIAQHYQAAMQNGQQLVNALNQFSGSANVQSLTQSLRQFPATVAHNGTFQVNLAVPGGQALRQFIESVIRENMARQNQPASNNSALPPNMRQAPHAPQGQEAPARP